MLRSLYIKNYALIEEFTVEFNRGLNIITGETGAGKSIVLGAFGLLIGERASSDIVRRGADKAIVEAEFEIEGNSKLKDYLTEQEYEFETAVILRREVSSKGTSRAFLNDSPVSAPLLKELGGYLVDLHGQHEHQSLLKADSHIAMLDDFGNVGPMLLEYQLVRSSMLHLVREIEDLTNREQQLIEERDLYEFQLQEITTVNPLPDEDEKLERELRILENSEELRDTSQSIHSLLYEEDGSIYEKLGEVKDELEALRKIDPSLEDSLLEAKSALAIVGELSKFFGSYSGSIELEPEKLAVLRSRAQSLQRLKKKYGGTMASLLEKREELERKFSNDENFTALIESKRAELEGLRTELAKHAQKLTRKRNQIARELEPAIVEILKELGIENGRFQVMNSPKLTDNLETASAVLIDGKRWIANTRGVDNIEFHISTNAGEELKPLVKVASGGEISRIMLALKSILARNDRLPLLVFDEIDVGISGRVAQRVGRAMKNLAAEHQIIAITHLAQIAAFSDSHYLVEKKTRDAVTTSKLRRLTDSEHVDEVARLISGDVLSESSLQNAKTLITEANRAQAAQVG